MPLKLTKLMLIFWSLIASVRSSDNLNWNCNQTNQFRCLTSFECIPKLWRCDQIVDCRDGSDEWLQSYLNSFDEDVVLDDQLFKSYEGMIADQQSISATDESWCGPCGGHNDENYECKKSAECIPRGWMCDGQPDCGQFSNDPNGQDDSDESEGVCDGLFTDKVIKLIANNNLQHATTKSVAIVHYNQTHVKQIQAADFMTANWTSTSSEAAAYEHIAAIKVIDAAFDFCWIRNQSRVQCLNGASMALADHIDVNHIDQIATDGGHNWFLLDKTNQLVYECNDHQICFVRIDHNTLSRATDMQLDADKAMLFICREGDRMQRPSQSLSPAIIRYDVKLQLTKPIVTIAIVQPKQMAIDHIKQRLYWIDGQMNFLQSVDYEGTNRLRFRMEFSAALNLQSWSQISSKSMIAYDNTVYLLNRQQTAKKTVTKAVLTGNTTNALSEQNISNTIISLAVITIANNDSHMMLFKQSSLPDHMLMSDLKLKLSVKSNNCNHTNNQSINDLNEPINRTEAILVYSRMEPGLIQFRNLSDGRSINRAPITFSRSPITFDIDPLQNMIYYVDVMKNNLLYQSLQPKTEQTLTKRIDIKFLSRNQQLIQIETIAFDWRYGNVYLLQSNAISVINFQNTETQVWHKELITDLIEPRALVLDVKRGLMFYTATSIVEQQDEAIKTIYPYAIRRANMNGSQQTILGQQLDRSISFVGSLAIDTDKGCLYWADTADKTLKRINYLNDDQTAERIWQSSNMNNVNSLVFFDDSLYWTEIQHGSIHKFNTKSNITRFILQERGPLFQLNVWLAGSKNRSPAYTKGDQCQQLTLAVVGDDQWRCACDDHYELMDDGNCRMLSTERLSEKFCPTSEYIYLSRGSRCVKRKAEESGKSDSPYSNNKQCQHKQFQCDNRRRCIPYHWLCDGHKDCYDQTDERSICQVISPPDFHCPDGYFKCGKRPLCIPQTWRCDQQPDCGDDDHTDEQNCNYQ